MLIAARESFAAAARNRLPYDAEVEYIAGTGTQWMDTGIALSSGDSFELRVVGSFTSLSANQLMGLYASAYFGIGLNSKWTVSGSVDTGTASSAIYSFILSSQIGDNKVSALRIYRPGYDRTWTHTRNNAAGTIGIMNIPGRDYCCNFNFEASRVFVNGTQVQHLIAVRKGATGCAYDTISGQLLFNAGTGSFTIGPDKTA